MPDHSRPLTLLPSANTCDARLGLSCVTSLHHRKDTAHA